MTGIWLGKRYPWGEKEKGSRVCSVYENWLSGSAGDYACRLKDAAWILTCNTPEDEGEHNIPMHLRMYHLPRTAAQVAWDQSRQLLRSFGLHIEEPVVW